MMPSLISGPAKNILRAVVPRKARNWLRSPTASARWTWDEIKFFCRIKKTVQLRPGWSLVCHPAAYRCAYFAQENDPEQVAEFDGFIMNSSEGMTLFDLGAHFGLFSLAALHYGGPKARAIAVDPSPTAARFLAVQSRLNHLAGRLQIIQAAVGDDLGPLNMVSVGVLASGYYVAPASDHPASELSPTMSVTIDSIAEELNVTPTHIKIDVEGFEAAVLRGGRKILSQTPAPLLFVEVHNEIVRNVGRDPVETLSLLRDYGYQTFTTDGLPLSENEILRQPLIRLLAKRELSR